MRLSRLPDRTPYGGAVGNMQRHWTRLQGDRTPKRGLSSADSAQLVSTKRHITSNGGVLPELAVVTIDGGEQLAEPLVYALRRETIIVHMWSSGSVLPRLPV